MDKIFAKGISKAISKAKGDTKPVKWTQKMSDDLRGR